MNKRTQEKLRKNHYEAGLRDFGPINVWVSRQRLYNTPPTPLPPVGWDIPMTTHKVDLCRENDYGSGLRGVSTLTVGFKAWNTSEETPATWQIIELIVIEGAVARSTHDGEAFCKAIGYPGARGKRADDLRNYVIARAQAVDKFIGNQSHQLSCCSEPTVDGEV